MNGCRSLEEKAPSARRWGCAQDRDVPWGKDSTISGPVPEAEKPALLSQIPVFVPASLFDFSSVAVLEAMASGVPGVVAERGERAEIARASSTGPLVDPPEPIQIPEAIPRLLRYASMRRDFSVRGRTCVGSQVSAGFVNCYQSVLRKSADARRMPGGRPPSNRAQKYRHHDDPDHGDPGHCL
jgi:glycosyltransferase involved in cell wall biosynthesis